MKGELYLESEITTEFTGSFSVYHEGDYTINVYYNNELIGSKDFYKLPTAGIYYDINSYQIHAETSLSGNISDTPEVYLDLYLDDTLIERYEGTIHGFENLVRGNTYEIRYIYVLNGVEHILIVNLFYSTNQWAKKKLRSLLLIICIILLHLIISL